MPYRLSAIAIFLLFTFYPFDHLLSQNSLPGVMESKIQQAESDSQRIDLKLQLIDEFERHSGHRQTVEEIRKILRLSTMSGYEKGYLNGLLKMGDHYLRRELPDSAMVPIIEGLSQSRKTEYRMKFLTQRGTANRIAGRTIQSLLYYEQAFVMADTLQMSDQKAWISYNMSLSQRIMGDYPSAFENLYRGLVHSEQGRDSTLMAHILNDVGEMYFELNNPGEGIYYLKESERLSRHLNLRTNLLRTLINLGITYTHLEDLITAESHFDEARALALETGDRNRLVRVDNNMGILKLNIGDLTAARGYFTEAIQISEQNGFGEGLYSGYMGMGSLDRVDRRYREALEWYRSALRQSERLASGPFKSQSLEEIYRTFKQMGRMAEALTSLETLREHTDNMRSLERERSRAEYETQLESRRQEQENRILLARQAEQEAWIQLQKGLGIGVLILLAIVLGVTLFLYRNVRIRERLNKDLQEKNREVTLKNEELDRLNNLKNKMFAIVAHDLRGPLSSLQSLLYLLRVHDLSKDDLHELTSSLEQNLQDNATTMENLLAWARSQMTGIVLTYRDFKLLAAADAVFSQIKFQAEQKEISIYLKIDPELIIQADYDIIKLIIRNLVSNSVKFCDSGDTITISASQKKKVIELRIEDTGVGISREDQEKIFVDNHYTKIGTKNEKGSGLGLNLCKEFVEKHGGKIWFESEPGTGTTFIFTLPIKRISQDGETSLKHEKVAEHTS